MYVFNAIQITALYAALPLAITFFYENHWGKGWMAIAVALFLGLSIFNVIGASRNLYDIDGALRSGTW